jgi:hypothetical protein
MDFHVSMYIIHFSFLCAKVFYVNVVPRIHYETLYFHLHHVHCSLCYILCTIRVAYAEQTWS